MVSMEPIECGARQGKSSCNGSEMECSSPASTSYGVCSPSRKDDVGSSPLSDHPPERERKWKAEQQNQSRRRLNASPGSRMSVEKSEAEDCGVRGNDKVEGKSSILNQGRKKQKGRKSFASKVCLEQNVDAMPVESEASGDEDQDDLSNSKTFERLVQLSELEEEVLVLHKRLAEELELRAVLETALEHASGTLTNFPRHLPISAQELLANITLLEVAVLKLEEQSSILQSEVGQARTEREIAELRHSSSESSHLGSERLVILGDDHTTRSPVTTPESQNHQLTVFEIPKLIEATVLEPSIPLGNATPGPPPDSQKLQKTLKEQQAITLRQDLRLTIPEVLEDDHATVSAWCLHHEYDPINGRQSERLKSFWKQNPLEDEDHWIPLNEHHTQALFAEPSCGTPKDLNGDPPLAPVGYVAHGEEPSRFSSTIGAETLRIRGPDMADLAEDDDKSVLPVAEVLWKPSTIKPSVFPKDSEKKMPKMVLLTTKPESWNFTCGDAHPRPESDSVSLSLVFEDQPCAQVAEAPSIDEQRTKYRIGVMKVREQRRQGILNSEIVKSLGSSRATSISSAKSGGLSSTWSPLDAGAQNENVYESPQSVEMKKGYDIAASFKSPNELSEQMVWCMISIYRHLADANNTTKDSSPLGSTQSPTSPFTAKTNSPTSSLSESSLLSVARSPLVDLRSKEVLGTDNSPDPFKARGKIPWADIGPYAHVLEISWLSVGKDQLEFAAQALRSFKILVEQLSRVDPSNLNHEEKLAFWINLYNALLMHAYLAYGIPRSDLKFFALLQKAAYTVGGYSFNAATIEFCLLRSKSTVHRPQLTLLTSLHKNKLTEDQSKFGIDHPESLVSFGLCSGTRSSPMVRVYTPRHVKSQLEDALHDYTRAAVGISSKGRLLVPKLLYTCAREFVEDAEVLDWICSLLPSNQVAAVCECIQQRRHRILGSRNFNTLPIDFTFRYLFPAEAGTKRVF